MFNRLFGIPKTDESSNALTIKSLESLNEQLEIHARKEKLLERKAAAEKKKALEFKNENNKKAAIRCLRSMKSYEDQIEFQVKLQLRIHDQMILLESAKATTETVGALRTGAAAMKALQKATKIDDVDKVMDEINEQTENMKLIQDALSNPIGKDFDEDELEAELEELEAAELEEELLGSVTTSTSTSAAPAKVPAGVNRQPSGRPVPEKPSAEEEELDALQAEMAL